MGALVKHNIAINNIQCLNAAVAMAHIQTQRTSVPFTLLDKVVVGQGSISATQSLPSSKLQPATIINLPLGNIGVSSREKHDNVQCFSEGDKENEAQELAINAKKMLYSAFLEALK